MEDTKVKDQDERSEWVAPTIKDWDVVAETQVGGTIPNPSDGIGTYS